MDSAPTTHQREELEFLARQLGKVAPQGLLRAEANATIKTWLAESGRKGELLDAWEDHQYRFMLLGRDSDGVSDLAVLTDWLNGSDWRESYGIKKLAQKEVLRLVREIGGQNKGEEENDLAHRIWDHIRANRPDLLKGGARAAGRGCLVTILFVAIPIGLAGAAIIRLCR